MNADLNYIQCHDEGKENKLRFQNQVSLKEVDSLIGIMKNNSQQEFTLVHHSYINDESLHNDKLEKELERECKQLDVQLSRKVLNSVLH
jgi:hypothetical protein